MKQGSLWLLCGIPGSGKTTWAKQKINQDGGIHVSRDEVRFSFLKENDEYFDRENEVFNEFIRRIDEGLKTGNTVYADATHLHWASRRKTLRALGLDKDENADINVIVFNTPLKECLARNSHREGRENVPEEVIISMYKAYRSPLQDFRKYNNVIFLDENFKEMNAE